MKTKTNFIFIIALMTGLATGGVFWYMQIQMQDKIGTIQEYYIKEKQNSKLEFTGNLDLKLQNILEQSKEIKSIFLTEDSIVSFVQQTEAIAQDNTLSILIDKLEKGEVEILDDEYSTQTIKFFVNISGDYSNIKNFVEQVQSQKQLIKVTELRFYKSNTDVLDTTYNARMILLGNIINHVKK